MLRNMIRNICWCQYNTISILQRGTVNKIKTKNLPGDPIRTCIPAQSCFVINIIIRWVTFTGAQLCSEENVRFLYFSIAAFRLLSPTERDCIYKLNVSCVWPRKYLCKSPRPEFHNIVSQFYSGVSLVKGGGSYKFHGQDTKMNVENEEWNKNVMSCSPLPGLWFESLQYIRYLVLYFTTSTGRRNTSHSHTDTEWFFLTDIQPITNITTW